jgi:hypothetical protein
MERATMVFGVALIALGVVGYVGTAAVSITALIPAIFGAVLVVLGWVAVNERYRKHAVHLAAAVALVGFIGAVPGLIGIWDLISGAEVQRPAAVVSQSFMAILMAVFVGLCVRSFVEARRARITRRE